jgi:4-amino-4-deoxy-L-arabinose transferase-like glycosyltransferase
VARRLAPWLVLLAAVLLLYGVNLVFPRDLWVQDEARYGEVVREMVASGSWFVPTLDGQFYPDKPPFYFWLLALQAKVTGLNMLSFRLVSLLSVLGFAAAFFVFARRLLGESRGLWAVVIVLTSQLFLLTGNIVRMDILLAALVVLSLHFLLRAVEEDRASLALAGYAAALAATMVKGPLGFAFPVLAALAYTLIRGKLRGLLRLRLPLGLALALAVALAWTAVLYAAGHSDYVEDVLFKQLWGRSVKSWSHPQPAYFYVLVLLPFFMPWLPFLRRGLRGAEGRVRLIALCWLIPGFALISAISGKLFVYMVPLFPPLALLVAAALPPPWEAEEPPPMRLAGLLCGLFFAAAGAGALWGLHAKLPAELAHLAPAALAPLSLGVVLIALALLRQGRLFLWALLGGSGLISWAVLGWGAAQFNPYFSAKDLGLELAGLKRAGFEPAAVDIARGTLSFYAGSTLRQLSAAELPAALAKPGRLAVVVRQKKRHLIPRQAWSRLHLVARYPRLEFGGYAVYVERRAPENPAPGGEGGKGREGGRTAPHPAPSPVRLQESSSFTKNLAFQYRLS